MRWQESKVLLCALLATVAASEPVEYVELEKPLIDFLTLDYLSVAETLWSAIETHADNRTIMAQVNDEHKRFLGSDFGETASLRHAYYVPDGDAREYYFQFIQNIQQLNIDFQTVKDISQWLMQNDTASARAIDRLERDIFVQSVKLSDSIYEEVSEARFWPKGKSVRL